MKLVLDTNIYCDFAEGVPEVVETLASMGDEILLPSVVIAELYYGFMKGSRQQYNEKKLNDFIEGLDVEIIDVTREVGRKYALIYSHLIKKGRKIPINDVWIAASCISCGGTLYTKDLQFLNIDMLDMLPIPD